MRSYRYALQVVSLFRVADDWEATTKGPSCSFLLPAKSGRLLPRLQLQFPLTTPPATSQETTAAFATHSHLYDIITCKHTTTEHHFHSHEHCLQSAETVACAIPTTNSRLGSDNVAEKRREATGRIAL
jgi:hypothetical protein